MNLMFLILFLDNLVMKSNSKGAVKKLFISAVNKKPKQKFGLLLSGGIDSTAVGLALAKSGSRFNCYFTGINEISVEDAQKSEPKDLVYAKKAAKEIGMPLKTNFVSMKDYEKALPEIVRLAGTENPVLVGVSSMLYFTTKSMKEKYAYTGTGSDEIFGGYNRFKESKNFKKDSEEALRKLLKNDLKAFERVAEYNNVKLVSPYLDKNLVTGAKKLSKIELIDSNMNKKVLREIALDLGLSEELAMRPKKAAQYGSNFDKAIHQLAKKDGYKSKKDYLESLKPKMKLGTLLSTGKDSVYAMYLMAKRGHPIECLIVMDSENKDSYMYHAPVMKLAKLQAQALGKKMVVVKTKGKKEKELKDLEKALKEAKNKFGIEGVTTGALYSEYQGNRIGNLCKKLGLECFNPLWHFDQKEYLEMLLKDEFEVVITKIACYGMDSSFLGEIIDSKTINALVSLEKKIGMNVAGEGGEYESLVLDMPLFKKKIIIEKAEKKMENEFTGILNIKKAKLASK